MQRYGLNFSKLLALWLCFTLASPLSVAAAAAQAAQQQQQQSPAAPAQQQQQQQTVPPGFPTVPPTASSTSPDSDGLSRPLPPGGIRILVLEGQKALNSIPTRSAVSPVVQVLDSQDQPVPRATVTFEVLPGGPGGTFNVPPAQPGPLATVRTDAVGQATAYFTPNSTPGRFTIKVTATLQGQSAMAAIAQTNDAVVMMAGPEPPKKHWYQSWKWWAVIGAGATVGIILLTRSSTKDPTVIIRPSPIDIGGPR
jgi:hypothetical protein